MSGRKEGKSVYQLKSFFEDDDFAFDLAKGKMYIDFDFTDMGESEALFY